MLPLKDIPDVNAETMIPHKRMRLSTFARLTWTLMALIVLSITWLIVSKFDFERLRGADHFVDQAREAVAQKDWSAALSAIRKVDGKVRTRPEFLQVVADYLKGTQTEPALLASTLAKLDEAGHLQDKDFLWLCRASLGAGNVRAARATLDRIPKSLRLGMEAGELRVSVLRAEGRVAEANAAEQKLVDRFSDHPKMAVYKAARELDGTFPEIQRAAMERLWKFAAVTDENGLRALRVLGRRPNLSAVEIEHLKALLDQHPDAVLDDSFNAASMMLRANPAQREVTIASEIERHKDNDPGTLRQLTAWLAREKEYARIMKLIPLEIWGSSVELFPVVAQGLAQQQQWQKLMLLLKEGEGKKLPVSDARAAGWRALAAKHLHPDDPSEARRHLIEAIQKGEAGNDGPALWGAAVLAEEWGMADLALKAYLKLADQGTLQEAEMLEKCWQMANILKEAGTLMKIAGRLTKLRPDNFALLRRQDYLRVLCGKEVELALATQLGTAGIEDNTTLLVRALKAYRTHDQETAVATLAKIQNITELTAGERAVYAGLLAKVRKETARAFQMAEKIPPLLLLPEENVFLQMAL